MPTHKPENLSSLARASSRRQKGENLLPHTSQIRPDCSQLDESLSHAPVTGCEHRYLKGDYRRTHSVLLRPYSLCPGISKLARQGLSLDNMGRYKPYRCYPFTCGHFPRTRGFTSRDIKHVCVCLPSVTLKAQISAILLRELPRRKRSKDDKS